MEMRRSSDLYRADNALHQMLELYNTDEAHTTLLNDRHNIDRDIVLSSSDDDEE